VHRLVGYLLSISGATAYFVSRPCLSFLRFDDRIEINIRPRLRVDTYRAGGKAAERQQG